MVSLFINREGKWNEADSNNLLAKIGNRDYIWDNMCRFVEFFDNIWHGRNKCFTLLDFTYIGNLFGVTSFVKNEVPKQS